MAPLALDKAIHDLDQLIPPERASLFRTARAAACPGQPLG